MKRLLTLAILAVASTTTWAFTFNDIQFWTGSGSNQAALVIDWNDGLEPQSLAWGYRWDGTATGEDMLRAIVAADTSLYIKISGPTSFGTALFGVGYDLNRDGFALSTGETFTDRILVADYGTADGATSIDPADHYQEGWNTGYWSYWLSDDGADWGFSGTGMSGRTLTDGAWDGWSFAPGFNGGAPSTPVAAVPEPATTLALLALGIGLAKKRRQK